MQGGPAGVEAGVDARHDQVGWGTETAERPGDHTHRRRAVHRIGHETRISGQADLLHVDVLIGVHATERGATTRVVVVGTHHDDVVTGLGHRPGQDRDPRAGDAVVVGDEDTTW